MSSAGAESIAPLVSRGSTRKQKLSALLCMSLIVNKMIGTGIFLTPSIIFQYCGGNTPLYLLLWFIGGVVVMSGLLIYLEFSLNLPFKNGGEKNYLLKSFPKPTGLVGCIYAFQMVLLGFSLGNSFAFGKYFLYAVFGYDSNSDSDWYVKFVGVLCITGCVWLHIKFPNQGTSLFNFLGIFKILILVLIIFIGFLVAIGQISIDSDSNVSSINTIDVMMNKSTNLSGYSIAIALLEIIYSFKGWENANYVLLEVSDPHFILTIVAPLAVLVTVVLYFLVILSYLIVIPKTEMMNSGVLVAGIFFSKIFGESSASKILPVLISFSNLGNVLVVSFAHGHVNQELAKSNYLPFSEYFEDLNHSLILHWVVTVLVLIAPPSSAIYEFVVNLYIYPGTWINIMLTVGLILIKFYHKGENWGSSSDSQQSISYSSISDNFEQHPHHLHSNIVEDGNENASLSTDVDSLLSVERRKFLTPIIFIIIFLAANTFLAFFPFIPPPPGSPAAELPIPYWIFPVIGTGVLLIGAVWFYTRKLFYSFRYQKFGIGSSEVEYKEDL